MLATPADPPLAGPRLVYEPKYDGIRALVELLPARGGATVRIWSRLGNEKTAQFPSLVSTLRKAGTTTPLLLDGEIVALLSDGRPGGFQRLQGRIHLSEEADVQRVEDVQPVALILFDLLRDGDDDVRGLPLLERRARLEDRLGRRLSPTIRLSEQARDDGHAMHARAVAEGWEGLIVKEAGSLYHSGKRSPAWRKLKLLREQEFVICGWTEPRQTRQHFGALLLGVYVPDSQPSTVDRRRTTASRRPTDPRLPADDLGLPTDESRLTYVGHTGTGFNGAELTRLWKLLKARETTTSPFASRIHTNQPAHWVRPELVAQVRFTEWTDDNKLRHPVYLGLRDDKDPRTIRREEPQRGEAVPEVERTKAVSRPRTVTRRPATPRSRRSEQAPDTPPDSPPATTFAAIVEQLRILEDARKDGPIELPDAGRLPVTNLAKPFWPALKLTKGDLLRYYATVAPLLLPAVADRPLVMKRFPNGVEGAAFYQQRSREERPPAGVRIETLAPEYEPISEPNARRLIGGSLITLLYMTQIAAISQDPWFSRVQSPLDADYVALDLDPDDDAPFERVLDVARWIRDELQSLGVAAVPKTSGSSGLHIYIPLPQGTSYESGMLFCQIVATVVATRHPRVATVERTVKARRRGTVYVDYLQNILGKTLATAYSARASSFAGVSTPLQWKEIDEPINPRDFTIRSAPERFARVGDLWGRLRTAKPANLEAVFKRYSEN
jgi:bifunctional non-homologous end joining protein LigD